MVYYHDKFASSPFFGQVFVCVVCLPFCTLKGLIMKVLHSHTNLKIIENSIKANLTLSSHKAVIIQENGRTDKISLKMFMV